MAASAPQGPAVCLPVDPTAQLDKQGPPWGPGAACAPSLSFSLNVRIRTVAREVGRVTW